MSRNDMNCLFTTKMSRLIASTFGFVTAALVCSGCASNEQVSFQSGGMTHTFSEGKEAIPKDFPLPIYPKATATGSVQAEGGSDRENSRFLMLASKDSVSDVSKFYLDKLKENGWKVDSQQGSASFVNLSASQSDLEANVMVSGDGAKTTISLAVSKAAAAEGASAGNPSDFVPNKITPPTD